MRTFDDIDALESAVGQHLGYSAWLEISQERVTCFARATDDDQWIHTDVRRAAAGPFGTTVAHGFLTLALLPRFSNEVYSVDGLQMAVNYGSDRVRYVLPVPVGSNIRAGIELLSVTRTDRGARATSRVVIERQPDHAPVCVADVISLLIA